MRAHVCMPCSGDATETRRGKKKVGLGRQTHTHRTAQHTSAGANLAAPSRMMRERVGPREGVDWCVAGAGIQWAQGRHGTEGRAGDDGMRDAGGRDGSRARVTKDKRQTGMNGTAKKYEIGRAGEEGGSSVLLRRQRSDLNDFRSKREKTDQKLFGKKRQLRCAVKSQRRHWADGGWKRRRHRVWCLVLDKPSFEQPANKTLNLPLSVNSTWRRVYERL